MPRSYNVPDDPGPEEAKFRAVPDDEQNDTEAHGARLEPASLGRRDGKPDGVRGRSETDDGSDVEGQPL